MERSLPRETDAFLAPAGASRHGIPSDPRYSGPLFVVGVHLTGDVTATGMQAITYLERHAVAMARSVRDLLSI
jgi:hypothetical protein